MIIHMLNPFNPQTERDGVCSYASFIQFIRLFNTEFTIQYSNAKRGKKNLCEQTVIKTSDAALHDYIITYSHYKAQISFPPVFFSACVCY